MPLELKFVMVEENDEVTVSICSPVVITRDTHILKSAGECTGNASESLMGSEGESFCPDGRDEGSNDPCWWCSDPSSCEAAFLTSSTPVWGDTPLKSVKIWARPLEYQFECYGEPLVEMAVTSWYSREWKVGAIVSGTCISGYLSDGNLFLTIECTFDGWEVKPPCVYGKYYFFICLSLGIG
ncbi:uncharacterized protein LOC121869081 [Homarus americanus]|uniref:uncharacterized protein LOC121869081 n=1 Tax=Homarus americanus TaxID=6706 RepID=UPI001C461180|nr:uncharacterized protein LOC121869081 [Homarus americanus]